MPNSEFFIYPLCVGGIVSATACVKLRGQLVGLTLAFTLQAVETELRSPGLAAKCFHVLRHLTNSSAADSCQCKMPEINAEV